MWAILGLLMAILGLGCASVEPFPGLSVTTEVTVPAPTQVAVDAQAKLDLMELPCSFTRLVGLSWGICGDSGESEAS